MAPELDATDASGEVPMNDSSMTELRARWIREAEALIDRKNQKINLLIEEAQQLEAEVLDARKELHFLKTGKQNVEAEAEPVRPASEPASEPASKPRRKPLVRLSDEELVAKLQPLGEFTVADAVKATGVTKTVFGRRLPELAERGLAKKVAESGRMVPGVGVTPARWRVTAIRRVA